MQMSRYFNNAKWHISREHSFYKDESFLSRATAVVCTINEKRKLEWEILTFTKTNVPI